MKPRAAVLRKFCVQPEPDSVITIIFANQARAVARNIFDKDINLCRFFKDVEAAPQLSEKQAKKNVALEPDRVATVSSLIVAAFENAFH